MYCTAPLSPRKGRLISFHDDDDDDDDIVFPLPTVAAINNKTQTTSCHAGQHSTPQHKTLTLA